MSFGPFKNARQIQIALMGLAVLIVLFLAVGMGKSETLAEKGHRLFAGFTAIQGPEDAKKAAQAAGLSLEGDLVGFVDVAEWTPSGYSISGWVMSQSETAAEVVVGLYQGGRFLGVAQRDQSREDVAKANEFPPELSDKVGYLLQGKEGCKGNENIVAVALDATGHAAVLTVGDLALGCHEKK